MQWPLGINVNGSICLRHGSKRHNEGKTNCTPCWELVDPQSGTSIDWSSNKMFNRYIELLIVSTIAKLAIKKKGLYTLMLTLNKPLELSSIKFTLYFHSKKHGHYCVFLLLFIDSLKLQFLHLVGRVSQHMPMLRYSSSMIGFILGW